MQCPKCGKTGFVNIGSNRFCSNCGAKLAGSSSGGPSTTMADISTMHKTLDLRQRPVTPDPTPSPVPDRAPPATPPAASAAQPAAQLHGQQVSGAGVLDLRAKPEPQPEPVVTESSPVPGSVVTPPPAVVPAPAPSLPTPAQAMPEVIVPAMPPIIAPLAEPEPVIPTLKPIASPTSMMGPSVSGPTPVPEPEPVAPPVETSIITSVVAPPAAPEPEPPVTAAPAPPAPVVMPQSPLIRKFPQHPAVPQAVAEASNVAATHVDAMSAQAANAPAPPSPPQSPALKQALAAAKQSTAVPSLLKIGTAVIAIGAMAGIVWLQNSPKLAFHTAAAKAGINASLPTYIPSSYQQSGPVTASAGVLTLQFTNPNASSIKITQQQTNWDSNSLRDNYVSHQTDSFSAVQGQGLTIYLYGNEADWINHGVWYQITGASRLSRDELLKVAYGL